MAVATAVRERTWRDEVTPVSRASRRRWALAYAALLVFAAIYVGRGEPQDEGAGIELLIALLVVFGMLRRSTRRLTAFDHPELDERDAAARDRAFRLAYPALLVVLVGVAAALLLTLPSAVEVIPQFGREVETSGWTLSPNAVLGVAVLVALWAVFLPTGVLAWLEPDGLEPGTGEHRQGLSEPARDALLAVGLVGGIAVAALTDGSPLGFLPLVVVIGILGRVARRDAPPPSTAQRVLPLVGLGLAVAFVLVVLAA